MSIRAHVGAPKGSTDDIHEPTSPEEAARSVSPPSRTTPAERTPSPTSAGDADDAPDEVSPVRGDLHVGRRGQRGRRRSGGRSADAPPSPKTRKRKSSTIPDGEWLPGTWPAGHGGGAVTSGVGVGVGVMETEQLIAEIERRPGIYDSGCPQYQDRVAKWTLWCEVCEIMTPRWHQLDEDRKAARVKELQKRWKSLRDSFMKELKLQREMQRTGQTANRKKYVFFDQMTFLMPCLEARGVSRSAGGFVLREVDPYESETDSSKADRDGGDCGDQGGDQSADATDCQSDDAPVNLSTANGGGCSALSLGLGLGSGITIGLSGIGGVGGLSSLAGHSVLGSATAVTGVSTASQADDDRVPLMLTTSSTTTISSSSAATGNSYSTPGSTTGKYRSVAATGSATTAGAAAGAAQTGDWKRRRSGTPINPYDDDEDDPDGDRLFLLSLAPSLRTLRGAAKSALKIELAQLVHKTLYEPDDALADSMTESLAPVVSLAEGLAEGSPASSTQSECGSCGSAKCTCRNSRPAHGHGHGHSTNNLPTSVPITLPLPLPLPLPLTLPLSLPRGLRSPKRARHIGLDFSNFNGHTASKLHGV